MLNKFKELSTWKKTVIIAVLLFAIVYFVYRIYGIFSVPDVDQTIPVTDLHYDDWEDAYMTPPGITIPEGIYELSINDYSTDRPVQVIVRGYTGVHNGIYSDDPDISPDSDYLSFVIWINRNCSDFEVGFCDTPELYDIGSISIKTAWNSKLYGVTKLILSYLAVIFVLALILCRKRLSKYSFEIMSLGAIAFICSLGLFVRYLIPGHDYIFHMLRIEGIKDALLLGDIPCKVQVNWCCDWGYAVSAAYGDITLLFPALLRLAGFTIQTSYKAFVISVNIATVIVCYLCFRQMCKDSRVVVFMTMLYSFAPYRLALLYYREATGEYTGMIFLPMIALGFYHAYMDDEDSDSYGKKLLVPVLGFSLLMQTHLVSCVMVGMVVAIFCIMFWKRTFSKKTFIYLAKIAGFSLLVTIWFLVPMFTFLREPLEVSGAKNYWAEKQTYALSLTEIFAQRASGTTMYNAYHITSLSDRFTTSLGNAFVVMLMVYLYLVWKGRIKEHKKMGCVFAFIGILMVFMSSNIFPYSGIWGISKSLAEVLLIVQYPYRYLTMAIIIFTLMIPLIYKQVAQNVSGRIFAIIVVIMALLAFDQAADMIYKAMYNGDSVTCYDIVSLYTNNIEGKEYVYEGTDIKVAEREHDPFSENVNLDSYSRLENRFDLVVSSARENASVSLPLYYYPGYTAWNDNGELLIVDRGDNNRIRISVPAGYSGGIKLRYRERKLWRLCEIISIIGFMGLIALELNSRGKLNFRKKNEQKNI